MGTETKKYQIIIIIIGIISILLFSWTTSPFFDVLAVDSDCFKLMGKMVAKGLIPYKDFFDHKGPLTAFIEYLGYGLFGNTVVLLIMQIFCFVISLLGILKLASLFLDEKKSFVVGLLSIIPCLLGITSYYKGGNIVEEWSLPFLVFSTYFLSRYFLDSEDNSNFDKKYSLFYGITMAVCVGTRVTNGIAIGIGIAILYITLLGRKKFKELLLNIIFFLIGFLIIALPIVVWFYFKGALGEMIYGSLIYNFKYLSNNQIVGIVHTIKKVSLYVVPFLIIIAISIYRIIKKDNLLFNIFLLAQSVMVVLFYVSGSMYDHYIYNYVPIITLGVAVLISGGKDKLNIILGVLLLGCFVLWSGNIIKREFNVVKGNEYKTQISDMEKVGKIINKSDGKKVIGYNIIPSFYLRNDLIPCYANFHFQDFQCKKDKNLKNKFIKDLKTRKADWIVVCNGPNIEGMLNNEQDNLISKLNYKEYYKNNSFILLKKGNK